MQQRPLPQALRKKNFEIINALGRKIEIVMFVMLRNAENHLN